VHVECTDFRERFGVCEVGCYKTTNDVFLGIVCAVLVAALSFGVPSPALAQNYGDFQEEGTERLVRVKHVEAEQLPPSPSPETVSQPESVLTQQSPLETKTSTVDLADGRGVDRRAMRHREYDYRRRLAELKSQLAETIGIKPHDLKFHSYEEFKGGLLVTVDQRVNVGGEKILISHPLFLDDRGQVVSLEKTLDLSQPASKGSRQHPVFPVLIADESITRLLERDSSASHRLETVLDDFQKRFGDKRQTLRLTEMGESSWDTSCVGWEGPDCRIAVIKDYRTVLEVGEVPFEYHAGRLNPDFIPLLRGTEGLTGEEKIRRIHDLLLTHGLKALLSHGFETVEGIPASQKSAGMISLTPEEGAAGLGLRRPLENLQLRLLGANSRTFEGEDAGGPYLTTVIFKDIAGEEIESAMRQYGDGRVYFFQNFITRFGESEELRGGFKLASFKEGEEQVTIWGRVREIQSPDNSSIKLEYDQAGLNHLTSITAKGVEVNVEYDEPEKMNPGMIESAIYLLINTGKLDEDVKVHNLYFQVADKSLLSCNREPLLECSYAYTFTLRSDGAIFTFTGSNPDSVLAV